MKPSDSIRSARILFALAFLALAAEAGQGPRSLGPAEAARLRGVQAPELGSMRAGAAVRIPGLTEAERRELQLAQEQNPGLGSMRAGMGDHDLLVIIAVAVVVIAVIVLV